MNDPSDSALYWIGLNSIPRIGRVTFRRLVDRLGHPSRVLAASKAELMEVGGLSEKAAEAVSTADWRPFAETELERVCKAGIAIVTMTDPAYPRNLRQTPDPPLYLYVKGSLRTEDDKAVAMVGTRSPTYYGKGITLHLASELAAAGVTIVSGMARGIDTQAHKGALTAKGRTIAVLGSGIDVPYPYENRGLMEEIASSGAVVSENPLGTRPEPGYFPARNRIISGLSLGTVIIEASADSGSLITADYTLEQGRPLFAVPGNIVSPASKGTNSLIKKGAVLVESADDILAGLSIDGAMRGGDASKNIPALTEEEEYIYSRLSNAPKHIDVITVECKVSPSRASIILLGLELKGLAKQLPGKYFVREV